MFIDGKRASYKYVEPHQSAIVEGFRENYHNSATEFLFTVPRPLSRREKDKPVAANPEAGMIRVELKRATVARQEQSTWASSQANFDAVNKKTAAHEKITAVSTSGRVVAPSAGSGMLVYYDMHEKLADFSIQYAQKEWLQRALHTRPTRPSRARDATAHRSAPPRA